MKLFTLFILIISYQYSYALFDGLIDIIDDLENEIQNNIKKHGHPFKDLVVPSGMDITDASKFKNFDHIGFDGKSLNPFNFSISNVLERFSAKHNRKYGKDEEKKRKQHLFNSLRAIAGHVVKSETSDPKYQLGLTSLADKSPEEYKRLLGTRVSVPAANDGNGRRKRAALPSSQCQAATGTFPQSFDWRSANKTSYVTSVKDQGQCGSCWAFSAVATLESQYLIKKKQTLDLSEEEVISCVIPGSDTCATGGNAGEAFDYIIQSGLTAESSVPYAAAVESNVCATTTRTVPVNAISYCFTYYLTDNQIMSYILNNGPVSVAIYADLLQVELYTGGYFNDTSCNTQNLDHAVTIVGWNTNAGVNYWIVKNSWGTSWGDKGYFYLARGSNMCGVNTLLWFPKLK